jgi:large subunit ribosomal protein L29
MKAHELRELSVAELESRLKDESEAIRNIKFNKAVSGSGENPAKLKTHRKEFARIQTVIREKSGVELPNLATV